MTGYASSDPDMAIANAISSVGTEAVIAGMITRRHTQRNETEADETWISKDIAEQIPKEYPGWKVLDRQGYNTLAYEYCGINHQDWPYRQFYDNLIIVPGRNRRLAVVEIKIVDENRPWNGPNNSMETDYNKIQKFQAFLQAKGSPTVVEGYLAGLICDIYRERTDEEIKAEDTIVALKKALLRLVVNSGTREPSIQGGKWGWRFVCGRLPDFP